MSRTTFFLYVIMYSSFWKMKVLEMKTRQTLVFDPGRCTGRLRACPFLGRWRALLCGEVFVWATDGAQGWRAFLSAEDLYIIFPTEVKTIRYTVRTAVGRNFPEPGLVPGGVVKVRRHEAM